jgi:hypothetical protein
MRGVYDFYETLSRDFVKKKKKIVQLTLSMAQSKNNVTFLPILSASKTGVRRERGAPIVGIFDLSAVE